MANIAQTPRKEERITFRLTKAQRRAAEKAARHSRMKLNAWVRQLVERAINQAAA